jgi:hypothetical protein
MQDSSHLTIILYSSVIKIVISQKPKFNRKIIIIHVFQGQSLGVLLLFSWKT